MYMCVPTTSIVDSLVFVAVSLYYSSIPDWFSSLTTLPPFCPLKPSTIFFSCVLFRGLASICYWNMTIICIYIYIYIYIYIFVCVCVCRYTLLKTSLLHHCIFTAPRHFYPFTVVFSGIYVFSSPLLVIVTPKLNLSIF